MSLGGQYERSCGSENLMYTERTISLESCSIVGSGGKSLGVSFVVLVFFPIFAVTEPKLFIQFAPLAPLPESV